MKQREKKYFNSILRENSGTSVIPEPILTLIWFRDNTFLALVRNCLSCGEREYIFGFYIEERILD